LFFYFFLFDIFFSILSICTGQKILEIFMFFSFYGLEILSKIFWKSWNIFLKNIDIWNLKFFINSTIYYLFFYFISIFDVFFSYFTYANLSKILNIFVVFYYTDYRFYERILENSSILIKKNRDIVNTKHFHNSIVHYLLFNFLVFLTSFFLVYPSMVFKKFLKFLCCFIVWIRDFIKNFSKTMVFFFKKNWDIWNPKFQQNSIFTLCFLFF